MSLIHKKKFILTKYLKLSFKNGKKESKEKSLRLIFSLTKRFKKINPLSILLDALQKAKPFCEIKSLRVKGSIQRVPVEIKQIRQKSLTLGWLLANTFSRNEYTFVDRLANELLDTSLLRSKTIRMCEDLHKIAEANKTFTQLKN